MGDTHLSYPIQRQEKLFVENNLHFKTVCYAGAVVVKQSTELSVQTPDVRSSNVDNVKVYWINALYGKLCLKNKNRQMKTGIEF